MITVDGLGTLGYPASVTKLSIWDMLDCKLANIFAMGSCKYTLFGSIAINLSIQTLFILILAASAILIIKTGIKATIATSATVIGGIFSALFALSGFLLLICLVPYTVFLAVMGIPILIYAAMIIDVLLRFALLTIISFVIIIILIISAPLFLCFYLFEATAGITKQWIGMLIGYMIYPGILVPFLALLLYTVDMTLYNLPTDTITGDALSACQNTKSFFCHYANYIGENPCTAAAATHVFNFLAKPLDILLFKNVKLFDPKLP